MKYVVSTYLFGYRDFSQVLFWSFWTFQVSEKISSTKKCQRDTMILLFIGKCLCELKDWTLTSIIRTGLPILGELIDLGNSVIIFLSQMTLLRSLTFLLGFQTVILTVLLFWIYFYLLMLVFVLQWLSLHWETLIMLLSQFPLVSLTLTTRCTVSLHCLWIFSFWLGWSLWSFERCSMQAFFYPSTFLQPVNSTKNSILNWVLTLNLFKYFFVCLSRKTLDRYSILLHHWFFTLLSLKYKINKLN